MSDKPIENVPDTPSAATHWENIYQNKEDHEVSWYQETPETSLKFIKALPLQKTARIIDVGGGNSNLTEGLLGTGFRNITLLDISESALTRTRTKLGDKARFVDCVAADILTWETDTCFHLWHDRAVFHFFTQLGDIRAYVEKAYRYIRPGGYLLISTFSKTGPTRCSGLDIMQYSTSSLAGVFQGFRLIQGMEEAHTTPFDTEQNFVYCLFQR